MERADIYLIAKNGRISVEMIEKYDASQIKIRIAAAVMRPKKTKIGTGKSAATENPET